MDLAATLQEAQARKNKTNVLCAALDHVSSSIQTLATTMRKRVRKAPSYRQLMLQNCHIHAKTWLLLKSLLVKVLCHHLQETFWHLLSVSE